MGDTTIRISEAAKARLDVYKREAESYEDAILRLTERERWTGFGALAETGPETRAGMRRTRWATRDGLDDDIEEGG